jgi:predicted metal-binding protein
MSVPEQENHLDKSFIFPSTPDMIQIALDAGASHAALISTDSIPFVPELRESCKQNSCGRYATNWVGPPAIGDVCDLMNRVLQYSSGLVIQTVDQLEDCFDYPGMVSARDNHKIVFRHVLNEVRAQFSDLALLALDAGCCDICPICTYPNEACRFPSEAIPSVEAYGINVNPMLTSCGLKYNNGKDTVSYVGLILFGQQNRKT